MKNKVTEHVGNYPFMARTPEKQEARFHSGNNFSAAIEAARAIDSHSDGTNDVLSILYKTVEILKLDYDGLDIIKFHD